MNNYIKALIDINKNAIENIAAIEAIITDYQITDDKSKVNFGNFCVALKGFRMVNEATECLLINENVLKDDDGNFYQKIESEPDSNAPQGSDSDKDKKHK